MNAANTPSPNPNPRARGEETKTQDVRILIAFSPVAE